MIKQIVSIILLLVLVVVWQGIFAQNPDVKKAASQKFTLNGYIEDADNGEKLIGATVFVPSTLEGTASNVYGFYSITLPEGEYEISFSYVGYTAQVIKLKLDKNLVLNVNLVASNLLGEVEIEAAAYTKIQNRTQMSMNEISIRQIKSLPVFLGEQDILKTIQLLPGVQSGSEGSSGFYVRGGGPDQNLILLDGVPVYNASHLFGFFSIFNPDAINNVKLYKGGFPARFGGRLSSVLDIRMKDGNMKEFHGEGSIGLISSKLSLEGPIIKDKTSFFVSARRTYIDLLIKPFIPKNEVVPYYFFYDVNTKINHKFSDNNRLYLSLYTGLDKFGAGYKDEYSYDGTSYKDEDDFFLDWGNLIWALRWNYIFNPKLFSNTTLTYSRYKYETVIEQNSTTSGPGYTDKSGYYWNFTSGIKDWTAKIDFDYMPGPNHYVRFGVGDINHTFTPGVNQFNIDYSQTRIDTSFGSQNQYANEMFAYVEDDYKINDWLKVNAGFHATAFLVNDKQYFSFQPRISARALISEKSSFKLSYSRMAQYLHLLTNPTIGLPTDLWVPTTDRIKPEYASQVALGYAHSLPLDLDLSIETYYKKMTGLIEYADGTSFFGNDKDWQNKVVTGEGWSYGAEFMIEKKTGKFTGWIGYTLSWTDRQFEEISQGNVFPYKYDRRHDVGIAGVYQFNDKFDVGIVWVYGTGNAFTLGLEQFQMYNPMYPDNMVWYDNAEYIENRNNVRMPPYHRLDLSFNFTKEKRWGQSKWSISFYNAYNRKNPFFLYIDYKDDGTKGLKQVSLFPIIPTATYSFKF